MIANFMVLWASCTIVFLFLYCWRNFHHSNDPVSKILGDKLTLNLKPKKFKYGDRFNKMRQKLPADKQTILSKNKPGNVCAPGNSLGYGIYAVGNSLGYGIYATSNDIGAGIDIKGEPKKL